MADLAARVKLCRRKDRVLPVNLIMPDFGGETVPARIEFISIKPGDNLAPGARLFDVCVDLSDSYGQDCPPVTYYRVISREAATVVGLRVEAGQLCEAGQIVAELEGRVGAAADPAAVRALRVTTAVILSHEAMWSQRPV